MYKKKNSITHINYAERLFVVYVTTHHGKWAVLVGLATSPSCVSHFLFVFFHNCH